MVGYSNKTNNNKTNMLCVVGNIGLKCYYRPTASLQLNNKRNTKYNITVT